MVEWVGCVVGKLVFWAVTEQVTWRYNMLCNRGWHWIVVLDIAEHVDGFCC